MLENLKSTYDVFSGKKADKILEVEKKRIGDEYDLVYYRSKATTRNLTDTNFLGNYFLKDKVMIHGGEHHMASRVIFPEGWNFMKEGSYLKNEFAYTKNKTYSCVLWGLSFSLDKMKNVDINSTFMKGAGEYEYIVTLFQKSYSQGKITFNDHYIISNEPTDLFTKYIIKRTESNNSPCAFVNKVDWDKIMNCMKKELNELYEGYKPFKEEIESFDSWIIVAKSPIIVARQKTGNRK